MFGKPCWFREARRGWGVVPACWQGWCWTLVWAAVLLVPLWLLAASERGPEALVWALVILLCWRWEVRQLRSPQAGAAAAGGEEVLYIGDEAENDRLATRNYDFRLRP